MKSSYHKRYIRGNLVETAAMGAHADHDRIRTVDGDGLRHKSGTGIAGELEQPSAVAVGIDVEGSIIRPTAHAT